ncbi:imidazole glycerol phosphate synthase subunit HisH [Sphingomonas lutea]|uniref:Imidazole glycerol phosphate synthase subunit HisH n=1 Tax=Sphingomonas lutea TaxID=1045317 RepID=A0A7G9SF05_9SPHN|nr:imidazole glycerol phosphate synthase subunit HisH [Sphingomonas lutea]QNN66430.1 imidazole glycerol phosphate synthase subunit HisH [Sphingomonas lutea]
MKLVIVDLGCGNVGSVRHALRRFGIKPVASSDAEEISRADKVLLPGVGAAGYAMERIDALGLRQTLTTLRQPALGICLGMQLLFERSEEAGAACLGIIPGQVRALQPTPGFPVPHMGWTRVEVRDPGIGIDDGEYFYFAHSFVCDDGRATVAAADYLRPIPAVIRHQNWLGAQFHPERSGPAGARFLQSFLQ